MDFTSENVLEILNNLLPAHYGLINFQFQHVDRKPLKQIQGDKCCRF